MGAALLARLDDSEWFVRVHAARAAGHVLGAEAAPTRRTPLCRRALVGAHRGQGRAARDGLRRRSVAPRGPRRTRIAFARNGAAEVLQDIGFVDFLALDDPRSPLLERIYAAGGERFREAAEARVERSPAEGVRAA